MYRRFFKPFLDILFALIVLPFFILLLILIIPIIYFTDPGPVFYIAKRIGKNGKEFPMYKFRSMKVEAPDLRNPDGSTYNSPTDPRLTKIGKFLRQSSIDEIPQIINVLKAEMSFVGPRPDLIDQMCFYSEEEKLKYSVLPGITGYSQAYFRNSIGWKERLKNDIYYAQNLSFLFDVKILLKTIGQILFRKNIYNGSK